MGAMSSLRHHVFGIMEVDVTEARRTISDLKKGGSPISFTSWLLKCVGDVVNKYPVIHGVKKGKRKIITFDSVEISITVLINHDVIDGSPAVRVINELVQALEGGYLL